MKDRISTYFEKADYHVNYEDEVKALKGKAFHSEFEDVEGVIRALDDTSSDNLKRLEYLAISFSKLPNP